MAALVAADPEQPVGWVTGPMKPATLATTRLAELLGTQGRQADAARRLEGVYASFTQGHGAPDLRDAKTVLDRLRT